MDILYIAVNILVFLLLAPLFEGVVRRITARVVQSRQGPPLLQPYYDILKLLGKQNLSAGNFAFRIAPLVSLASILGVIVFLPLGHRANVLTKYADIVTVIYLLTMGGVGVLLGALSSRNTFALIGSSREMITMIMVEPVLAMTFILGAVKIKSLGITASIFSVAGGGYGASVIVMMVAYLAALQAFVGRQPFDIAEAEVEILEGPFIEYSGPNFALFKYYLLLKQMFYAMLFVIVFIPAVKTGLYGVDVLIQLAFVLLVYVLIALLGSTHPRLRIDQAQKIYGVLIAASLVAVGLSVYGI
ncbi:MAG: NADH-quinone oxidoreductase subunit H [Spirochaetes bacterium]|nr:NADH-quinone oxidoreductase subunit H [Spirochaetota bacterium]